MFSIPTDSLTRSDGTSSGEPGHRGVRHPGRVLDQRLDAAERLAQREQPGPPAHLDRRRLSAGVPERHHAAEAPHLLRRHLVAGMIGQPRIVDPRDPGVVRQHRRHLRAVVAVPVHPDGQGLDSAQGQPGVERAAGRADSVLQEGQPVGQVGVGDDERAADHVGVAAQVLGGRVDHGVGPEGERLLQVGRGERVVHREQGAGRVRDLRERADVGDRQQRVGRRLDPDQPRAVRGHRGPDRVGVGDRHRVVGDSPARHHLVEQPERAAVRVVRDQHVVAWLADRADQAVLGGHPRRERQRPDAAFERGQALLERPLVGLAVREYS